MPDDHIRFRCYRCSQLLGASAKRVGSIISCPRCGAELKVPRAEDQLVSAEASRSGPGVTNESRTPSRPGTSASAPAARTGGSGLPTFMDEIAAAIPDELASLRPEDIRVEAEFADLVVTTNENFLTSAPPAPPATETFQPEQRTGDPAEIDAHLRAGCSAF